MAWPPFQILATLPPPFPVASNLNPHCSFCYLVSLTEWVVLSDYTMDLLMSRLRTLMCVLRDKM